MNKIKTTVIRPLEKTKPKLYLVTDFKEKQIYECVCAKGFFAIRIDERILYIDTRLEGLSGDNLMIMGLTARDTYYEAEPNTVLVIKSIDAQ